MDLNEKYSFIELFTGKAFAEGGLVGDYGDFTEEQIQEELKRNHATLTLRKKHREEGDKAIGFSPLVEYIIDKIDFVTTWREDYKTTKLTDEEKSVMKDFEDKGYVVKRYVRKTKRGRFTNNYFTIIAFKKKGMENGGSMVTGVPVQFLGIPSVSFWLKEGVDAKQWVIDNELDDYDIEYDEDNRVNVFDLPSWVAKDIDKTNVVDFMIDDELSVSSMRYGGRYGDRNRRSRYDEEGEPEGDNIEEVISQWEQDMDELEHKVRRGTKLTEGEINNAKSTINSFNYYGEYGKAERYTKTILNDNALLK